VERICRLDCVPDHTSDQPMVLEMSHTWIMINFLNRI
jgi:hypothetical protein